MGNIEERRKVNCGLGGWPHRHIANIHNSITNVESMARCQLVSCVIGFPMGSKGPSRALIKLGAETTFIALIPWLWLTPQEIIPPRRDSLLLGF